MNAIVTPNRPRTIEIVGEPVEVIPDLVELAAPTGEFEPVSGKPHDELQRAAEELGRVNVSYQSFWEAVERAGGKWVIFRCNSARRAALFASAALQHRTRAHNVARRGRMVMVRTHPSDLKASA